MGNNTTKYSTAHCNITATTSVASTPSNISQEKEEKNYESFALLWLDVDVNKTNDNLMTQNKLREAVNYIKTFDTIEVFEKWLNQRTAMSKKEKFILIVSEQLGEIVVPKIHALPQLVTIYLYCMDNKSNEMWAKQFRKVKAKQLAVN
jgi:hypothetical protein